MIKRATVEDAETLAALAMQLWTGHAPEALTAEFAALLAACEQWAREKGCQEFASDCELDNRESLRFHLALGFAEANRIVCFRKAL